MRRGGGISTLGRAPVPEWEEVARAAWPGRLASGLAGLASRAHLPALLLSYVGLLAAAWFRAPWLGLGAWIIGAVVEWLATSADSNIGRLLDLVGVRPQLRALLRSTIAAALVFACAGQPVAGLAFVTVIGFLQLAWLAQPVLATWVARSAPPLRYLPGSPDQPGPFAAHARVYARAVGTPGFLVALEFVVLAKALATAIGWMDLILDLVTGAVAVLVALGWLLWAAQRARALRSRRNADADALLAEVEAEGPTFVVYVSLAARQSKYIVNQWLPALDELSQTGVLLVREASQLAVMAATRQPVVYAPSQRDVERMLTPRIRAAFYLAYGERNGQLLRDPRLVHIMLLHGDSDKATSANGMARAFDEVWVAGPAAIERYREAGVNLEEERFVPIGRPQVAGLPVGPSGHSTPVVLYAPTFEGYYDQTSHSSLDTMGVELVRRLLADGRVQVRFRPHPASGVTRPSMLAAIEEIRSMLRSGPGEPTPKGGAATLPECLAEADLLISDISSVATDYLFTERPVITCDPAGLAADAFIAAYPSQAASYLLHPGLAELDSVLDAALGPDPLRAARAAMKRHILGDPPGGPQAAFAANVARVTAA